MANNFFDLTKWLNLCGWSGEAREQARNGFHAGWDWAESDANGTSTMSEEDAYAAGEGHYGNGFDEGRDAYQSGQYTGGVGNY